jgi:oxygen-independent coproporphyrinogen-3 oxidase
VAIRKPRPQYGDEYLDRLETELALIGGALGQKKTLQQMHWGGGTPTFLSIEQLSRLWEMVGRYFEFSQHAELAIEIEPRTVDFEMIEHLKGLGFNRVSMGVQDLDPKVQEAVNRVHSFEKILEVSEHCRNVGFSSINMDLIYGLPHQSQASFSKTVEKMLELNPNRLALYSFAHVPWLKKHQKKIDPQTLPNSREKVEIFLDATRILLGGDYQAIAMDHFARADDEMALAYREGRLHRNFMGYTVLPGDDFIGVGVSSIGYVQGAYLQNIKDLVPYGAAIDERRFPVERGLVLSKDDLIRRSIIRDLMCRFELDTEKWSRGNGCSFDHYFAEEKLHLDQCVEDGLLYRDGQKLLVTDLGKLFVRNIAMGFDAYLRKEGSHRRFSRTI